MPDIPLQDVTYRIIGAAMGVHNHLGPGLKEVMYQRALSTALTEAGLAFEEERPFQVTLEGERVGLLFLDHFVEGAIVVEEKAFPHLLTAEETAQVITYMAVSGASVGLLLNFGRSKLESKRILPPKKFADWRARATRYAWRPAEAVMANPLIRSSSVDRAEFGSRRPQSGVQPAVGDANQDAATSSTPSSGRDAASLRTAPAIRPSADDSEVRS